MMTSMMIMTTQFTDDLVPLLEFTNEHLGAASKEIFTGSVSQTEEIIDKHLKIMDKIDKKKKDVNEIISRGSKLTEMAKAPVRSTSITVSLPPCAAVPEREARRNEQPVEQYQQSGQTEAGRSQGVQEKEEEPE